MSDRPSVIQPNTVGIMPAGALGVAQFYWLTDQAKDFSGRVFFMERKDSRSAAQVRDEGKLYLRENEIDRGIDLDRIWRPDLAQCLKEGKLPEVILIATNPDQLLPVIREIVEFIEALYEDDRLFVDHPDMPKMVLCSNGIYFQRIRAVFIETLEESILYGRLPDLWPETMPKIIGRLLRGVTIQSSIRIGGGSKAVYRPGPPGLTQLAGTADAHRLRAFEILREGQAPYEECGFDTPTHVEFKKALINLIGNFLGMIYCIDDEGTFEALRMRDIYREENLFEIRTLIFSVVEIGKAVNAFQRDLDPEDVFEQINKKTLAYLDHKSSSVQLLEHLVKSGKPPREITPTEYWLLNPLQQYARAGGLTEALAFLNSLEQRLLEKFSKLPG